LIATLDPSTKFGNAWPNHASCSSHRVARSSLHHDVSKLSPPRSRSTSMSAVPSARSAEFRSESRRTRTRSEFSFVHFDGSS
jgi:hypothetical protein